MTEAHTCYIGLGSNLADPLNQVRQALLELAELAHTQLLCHSSLYRSDPLGPPNQPDYINAVAKLETRLEPLQLLDALQALERTHQRIRREHWGPRTLDLDILLYAQLRCDEERLILPHPHIYARSFVLAPLAEIAPELRLPNGQTVSQALSECPMGLPDRLTL